MLKGQGIWTLNIVFNGDWLGGMTALQPFTKLWPTTTVDAVRCLNRAP
jgi:hypothetical protein